MPCDCSHLRPTEYEAHQREAAKVLLWLKKTRGETIEEGLEEAAKHRYGYSKKFPKAAESLCEYLKKMSESEKEIALLASTDLKKGELLLKWWNKHREYDDYAAKYGD